MIICLMPQVICIGSASKDIFFPTGEGIIIETPEDIEAKEKVMFEVGAKYQVEDRYEAPGGVAANASIGLARLGIYAACYSQVGSDAVGDWVVAELRKEGVDTGLLVRDTERWTDLSSILVFTQTGDRTIFFNRDANERLVVDMGKLVGAEWLFVSALNGAWKENLHTVLDAVRTKDVRLALNPGQRNLKDNPQAVVEAAALASVLVLNKDEAIMMVEAMQSGLTADQLNDEAFLIGQLHGLGAEWVGLTDGARGAWASDGESVIFSEAISRRVVDTTGAGDAFGSGFLAARFRGRDIGTALHWGMAESASVVQYYGAQEGLLRESDVLPGE